MPGKNCNVRFASLKYWPGSFAYSESVWQGCVGQDVLVDVGLTWRVTPQVSEGKASKTTVKASMSTPWWEAILGNLLREIVVITNIIVSCPIIKQLMVGRPENKDNGSD